MEGEIPLITEMGKYTPTLYSVRIRPMDRWIANWRWNLPLWKYFIWL